MYHQNFYHFTWNNFFENASLLNRHLIIFICMVIQLYNTKLCTKRFLNNERNLKITKLLYQNFHNFLLKAFPFYGFKAYHVEKKSLMVVNFFFLKGVTNNNWFGDSHPKTGGVRHHRYVLYIFFSFNFRGWDSLHARKQWV